MFVDSHDNAHTVHFLDPPYWIADFMRTAKGRVILSINDHHDIRRLFEHMNIIPLQLRYSISRTKDHGAPSGEMIINSWADT
ncbi:hypothetical protein [Xylella fastidiosa]|uniref:hypothetical protein n=1 Tax=Xylella fastidiosa TaxID=2371 RepID=UPI001EEC4A70|nr:hypothetical protein [Xylella fastidiosa]WLE26930.1 hypothetical protein DVS74_009105 [Xylella fastidiosa subsp. multiplex]